jgi:hypothetical protein
VKNDFLKGGAGIYTERMKTLLLILCFLPLGDLRADSAPSANLYLLRNQVLEQLVVEKAPLDEVIDLIRDKTRVGEKQVNFVIPAETKASTRLVTLDIRGVNAMDAFSTVLSITGTRAELRHNMVFILPK